MPDYQTMKQEAIGRALEMQRRARKPQPAAPAPEPENPEPHKPEGSGCFELLFRDEEKTLLLLLLLIFSEESADPALIFALLYLFL